MIGGGTRELTTNLTHKKNEINLGGSQENLKSTKKAEKSEIDDLEVHPQNETAFADKIADSQA